ncbi:hypothetical protein D3C73_1272090 [compost metagenome]
MFGLPAAVVFRFLDLTAISGRNRKTKAYATAPPVPKFPSATFTIILFQGFTRIKNKMKPASIKGFHLTEQVILSEMKQLS